MSPNVASSIPQIENNKEEINAIYNTAGIKQKDLQKNLNIVKMKDGMTKKIIK
ncbi:hypothetical protein [Prevotella disiens]|uniref:hypothetical protein n=1 Tax=Prevotella disiens TaxID=28130 RepID=UPI003369E973